MSKTDHAARARAAYQDQFGGPPACTVCAPGRVELLGNHTDYNEGFIISAALDMQVYISAGPRDDNLGVVYSAAYNQTVTFDAEHVEADHTWADYVKGIVAELQARDMRVGGFNAVIISSLPEGTGLSSSAALEVAVALALQELFPYAMAPFEMARMCRSAENKFVGMNCGILDQFSSIFGIANGIMFLDCRSYEYETVPLAREDVVIVICNSMEKHRLVSSQFNQRREECFAAADFFKPHYPGVEMLRDVTPEMFEQERGAMPAEAMKRACHIVYENQRVLDGRQRLKEGDLKAFGALMNASHASSAAWFENSTEHLDLLQEAASGIEGVIGAKLSGGGFGGCIVALAAVPAADALAAALTEVYQSATGISPDIHFAGITAGAHVISS